MQNSKRPSLSFNKSSHYHSQNRADISFPNPILWRRVIPPSCFVNFSSVGTRQRSQIGRNVAIIIIKDMTKIDGMGISNLGPRCRSILMACPTTNVPICMGRKLMIADAHIGTIIISQFTSSTCCMLHSLRGFIHIPSCFISSLLSIMAAFFKNLIID